MNENFWTVERLTEVRRGLEIMAEPVDGADHQLIRINQGLGRSVWQWLNANSTTLKIGIIEVNAALVLLKNIGVISPQLQRSGPERYHRHFYPKVKIDEKAVAKAYGS